MRRKRKKKFSEGIGGIVAFLVLAGFAIACAIVVVNCQFAIYQKKHGDDMTFADWLLDPELNR